MTLLALTLGLACTGNSDDSGDTAGLGTDDSGQNNGTDDSGDNNNGSGDVEAKLKGTVTVQLYTYDDDGELEFISFEDAYGGTFPFGSIWVTAYEDDGAGKETYHGSYAVHGPSTDPNDWEIEVELDESKELRLYAQLDYWKDGILGSNEPLGIYPDAIVVEDGDEHEGLDITILAPYDDGSGSGGGGGGSGCDAVSVDGDVLLTKSYAGGDAVAMLLDTNGEGPWDWDIVSPQSNGSGAEAAYGFGTCANLGAMKLVGAHDRDGDLLFTPMDTWGAYISSPDVDGNPISIATSDLSGYDIQIPLGDGDSPFDVVPWVSISGDLGVTDGVFDDLAAGTKAYVVALKYRPTSDITAASIEAESWDVQSFEWSDLSGQATVPYSLTVPANTIVYLWAYADTDSDGTLNEEGEPVASGGVNGNGKFPTGTSSTSGQDMNLNVIE